MTHQTAALSVSTVFSRQIDKDKLAVESLSQLLLPANDLVFQTLDFYARDTIALFLLQVEECLRREPSYRELQRRAGRGMPVGLWRN